MAEKIFKTPFATQGDVAVIPDALQPTGAVSFAQGFGPDYERPNTDPLYKPVPRDETNYLYRAITSAIGELQIQGLPSWATEGAPYPIEARVRHANKVWRSSAANNNTTPGASGATWEELDIQATQAARGLTRFANATEARAWDRSDLALSPVTLKDNVMASLRDTTINRLATTDAHGLGFGTQRAPVLADFLADNPSGFYRANGGLTSEPTLNGPAGTGNNRMYVVIIRYDSTLAGITILQSSTAAGVVPVFSGIKVSGTIKWNRMWTDGNLNPSSFAPAVHTHSFAQVPGLQAALDAKVNVAGDARLFGTLQTSGLFRAAATGISEYSIMGLDSFSLGNNYNIFRFLKQTDNMSLYQYNWDGALLGRVFGVAATRRVEFDQIPFLDGQRAIRNGDTVNHEGNTFVITLSGSGTFLAPDFHTVIGVQTDSAGIARYLVTRRMIVRPTQ